MRYIDDIPLTLSTGLVSDPPVAVIWFFVNIFGPVSITITSISPTLRKLTIISPSQLLYLLLDFTLEGPIKNYKIMD